MRQGVAVWLLVLAGPVVGQEVRIAEEYAAEIAAARPGPEHAGLERLAGRWEQEMTLSLAPGETTTVRGVATNRMILGGRFLVSESRTDASLFGERQEAMWVHGFDRRSGEYTIVGMDTFGTYWVSAQGKGGSGDTVVMSGVNRHPQSGREESFDVVVRWEDAHTYVMEIVFVMPDGSRLPVVTVRNRRAGAEP